MGRSENKEFPFAALEGFYKVKGIFLIHFPEILTNQTVAVHSKNSLK